VPLSIADEQNRFALRDDDTRELIHPGEMVIEAVGQSTDESLLAEAHTEALEWRRRRLNINEAAKNKTPTLLQWRRTSHYPVILPAPLCVKPYSRTSR